MFGRLIVIEYREYLFISFFQYRFHLLNNCLNYLNIYKVCGFLVSLTLLFVLCAYKSCNVLVITKPCVERESKGLKEKQKIKTFLITRPNPLQLPNALAFRAVPLPSS